MPSDAKHAALTPLARRLRAARERTRLAQQAVAKHLGVTAQTVRNWEASRYEPDLTRISALASLYGIPVERLTADSPPLRHSDPSVRIKVDPHLLAQARKDAGLTLTDASKRSGVSRTSIRRYENGGARPTRAALWRLALTYGKPPSWLDPDHPDSSIILESSRMDEALRAYLELQPDLTPSSVKTIANFILFTHQNQIPESQQPRGCPPVPQMAS